MADCWHQLCLMNTQTKQFTIYDHNDGLPERVLTGRRIYFDKIDSQMYSVHRKRPDQVFAIFRERRVDNSGALMIEDSTINNDSVIFHPGDKIVFGHNDNNLAFRVTVVDYERSNYQFAYRLNHSSAWNYIGNQNSIFE